MPVCVNLFVPFFLVTPCLVVTVQPGMEGITVKKEKENSFMNQWQKLNRRLYDKVWYIIKQIIRCTGIVINVSSLKKDMLNVDIIMHSLFDLDVVCNLC